MPVYHVTGIDFFILGAAIQPNAKKTMFAVRK